MSLRCFLEEFHQKLTILKCSLFGSYIIAGKHLVDKRWVGFWFWLRFLEVFGATLHWSSWVYIFEDVCWASFLTLNCWLLFEDSKASPFGLNNPHSRELGLSISLLPAAWWVWQNRIVLVSWRNTRPHHIIRGRVGSNLALFAMKIIFDAFHLIVMAISVYFWYIPRAVCHHRNKLHRFVVSPWSRMIYRLCWGLLVFILDFLLHSSIPVFEIAFIVVSDVSEILLQSWEPLIWTWRQNLDYYGSWGEVVGFLDDFLMTEVRRIR